MPCIKIVDEPYENYTDTYHLIHEYIFLKAKYFGGLAVDPVYASEQMDFCRGIWGKNNGAKIRHFVLTYGRLYDILVGTFLVVGLTEDDFGSLGDGLLEKYTKFFALENSI